MVFNCMGKHYSNVKLLNHTKKGSFWWRENLKPLNTYKTFAKGSSTKWEDMQFLTR